MTASSRGLAREIFYGILAGCAAALFRAAMQPLLGDQLPFILAFPATVLASVFWGSLAGTLTAVVCAAAVALPFFPPDLQVARLPAQVGTFLIGSVLIAIVCGQLSRRVEARPREGEDAADTPLSNWLRAVLWGALVIPFVAFLVIAWWGYERTQREAVATVDHASELILSHAQRTFDIAHEIARRADAASAGDDAAVRAHEAEIHQRLVDMASGVPSIVNLNVWDANGQPLARSDVYPVDPMANVSDREYFQQQRWGFKGMGVSDVIRGRQTGLELTNATIARTSPAQVLRAWWQFRSPHSIFATTGIRAQCPH